MVFQSTFLYFSANFDQDLDREIDEVVREKHEFEHQDKSTYWQLRTIKTLMKKSNQIIFRQFLRNNCKIFVREVGTEIEPVVTEKYHFDY